MNLPVHITTHQKPATFEEACDQVRKLEEKASACIKAIRAKGKELILYRFRQGRAVDLALPMERSGHYGDGVASEMARKAGMSPSVLYRALEFYRHPQFKGSEARLLQWMDEVEEEKGAVTWSYCRNFAQKALPASSEKAEQKLRREIRKLEKASERLEHQAVDLEREVMRWNGDLKSEALGVVAKAVEVAEDTRRGLLRTSLAEPEHGSAYLAYIRSRPCCACHNEPARPYALGESGADLKTVPLCDRCRRQLEAGEPWQFWDDVAGMNPWKAACELLAAYVEDRAAQEDDTAPVDFEYDD